MISSRKTLCAFLVLLGVALLGGGQDRQQWRLVWADEFDYHGLPDPKKWSYDVGGTWGGEKGVDENIWPQRMEIDYVRIYQR